MKANKEDCGQITFDYVFTLPEAGQTTNDINNPVVIG